MKRQKKYVYIWVCVCVCLCELLNERELNRAIRSHIKLQMENCEICEIVSSVKRETALSQFYT